MFWDKIERKEDGMYSISGLDGKRCRCCLRDLVNEKVVTLGELDDLIKKMPNNTEASVELLELLWCMAKN